MKESVDDTEVSFITCKTHLLPMDEADNPEPIVPGRVKARGQKNVELHLELRIQPGRVAKAKSSEVNIQREIIAISQKYAKLYGPAILVDDQITKQIDKSSTVFKTNISDTVKNSLDRESGYEEYEEEIYTYLREAEMRNRARPGYINIQKDFTSSNRCILVNSMVEVSEALNLHRETLFLAVNYVDRFLSKMPVSRRVLPLVGAASLFIATKYEENRCCLRVKDFASIIDYTIEELVQMEEIILDVLAYNIAMPTPSRFCEDFVTSCDGDDKLKALSMFLCELTLIEMDTGLKYVPSITASASLCLARYSLGLQPWTAGLAKKTGYEVGHFEDCLRDLHKIYLGAETHQHQAVQEKYKNDKYHQVSDFTKYPVPNIKIR